MAEGIEGLRESLRDHDPRRIDTDASCAGEVDAKRGPQLDAAAMIAVIEGRVSGTAKCPLCCTCPSAPGEQSDLWRVCLEIESPHRQGRLGRRCDRSHHS